MNTSRLKNHWETMLALVCVCLMLFISACQIGNTGSPTVQPSPQSPTSTPASAQGDDTPAPTTTPVQGTSTPVSPRATAVNINYNHPVLAFYYTWYTASTWSSSTM